MSNITNLYPIDSAGASETPNQYISDANGTTEAPGGSPHDAETHPLRPFLPEGAKLLMCGTFPPQRHRWSMNFYYPNYINDMWRVFGLIYHNDKDWFVDTAGKTFKVNAIREMLTEHHIALSDTGREVVRTAGNASDKFLDIKRQIDLPAILCELPECVAIATTGEKAAGVIAMLTGSVPPKMGECTDCTVTDATGRVRQLKHWRMPSTSRAYPMPLADKATHYAKMVSSLGL